MDFEKMQSNTDEKISEASSDAERNRQLSQLVVDDDVDLDDIFFNDTSEGTDDLLQKTQNVDSEKGVFDEVTDFELITKDAADIEPEPEREEIFDLTQESETDETVMEMPLESVSEEMADEMPLQSFQEEVVLEAPEEVLPEEIVNDPPVDLIPEEKVQELVEESAIEESMTLLYQEELVEKAIIANSTESSGTLEATDDEPNTEVLLTDIPENVIEEFSPRTEVTEPVIETSSYLSTNEQKIQQFEETVAEDIMTKSASESLSEELTDLNMAQLEAIEAEDVDSDRTEQVDSRSFEERYKDYKLIINKKYRDGTLGAEDIEEYMTLILPIVQSAELDNKLSEIQIRYNSLEDLKEFSKYFIELKKLFKLSTLKVKGW